MIVNSINLKPQNKNLTFGQIVPEHLFIRMPGYGKDLHWANTMVDAINTSIQDITAGNGNFESVLNFVAEKYRNCFHLVNGTQRFGVFRNSVLSTYIISKRYHPYQKDIAELIRQKGRKDVSIDWDASARIFKSKRKNLRSEGVSIKADIYTQHIDVEGSKIPATTSYRIFKTTSDFEIIKNLDGKREAFVWHHPWPEYIPKLMGKAKTSFLDVLDDSISKPEIINQKIGKLHWLLIQTMPFDRGSAGISDVITKILFEVKNIQVSKWRKNIAPDMEALVTPMEEYQKRYVDFFDTPPRPF